MLQRGQVDGDVGTGVLGARVGECGGLQGAVAVGVDLCQGFVAGSILDEA